MDDYAKMEAEEKHQQGTLNLYRQPVAGSKQPVAGNSQQSAAKGGFGVRTVLLEPAVL